ncbi:MAG: L,D-transpeptidase [Caldilineaceae bacterium]
MLLLITSWFGGHPQAVFAQDANGIFNVPPVVRGTVDIFGVANHEAFRKWQLDILIDGDEKQAAFVAVSDQPLPELSKLTTLNTSRYPDGKHTLRLRVAYTGLQYDEFFAPVTITNNGAVALPIPDEGVDADTISSVEPPVESVPASKEPIVYDPNNYWRTLEVGSGYQPTEPISRNAKRSEIEAAQEVDVVHLKTDVPDGPRRIEIDLSEQKLTAYQGDEVVMVTQVSTGRKNGQVDGMYYTETVTGTYKIQRRYEKSRMTGPGYDTPDVPYVQYFFRGYAIHGAYWHNEFGMPVSHGCINMRVEEAKELFDWADVGTEVEINE